MNILDENLPGNQVALLESWRIHVRQISLNIGRRGMSDEDIIPLLLHQHLPTFFTRDKGSISASYVTRDTAWLLWRLKKMRRRLSFGVCFVTQHSVRAPSEWAR